MTIFTSPSNSSFDKQPPGNDVSIPRVDDRVHILIEQVTMDDADEHRGLGSRFRGQGLSAAQIGDVSLDGLEQILVFNLRQRLVREVAQEVHQLTEANVVRSVADFGEFAEDRLLRG